MLSVSFYFVEYCNLAEILEWYCYWSPAVIIYNSSLALDPIFQKPFWKLIVIQLCLGIDERIAKSQTIDDQICQSMTLPRFSLSMAN